MARAIDAVRFGEIMEQWKKDLAHMACDIAFILQIMKENKT